MRMLPRSETRCLCVVSATCSIRGVSPTCFFRELVMAKGRLAEALTRVHIHACSNGSELSNLFPQHGMSMWSIAQDILRLNPVCELFEYFYSQLLAQRIRDIDHGWHSQSVPRHHGSGERRQHSQRRRRCSDARRSALASPRHSTRAVWIGIGSAIGAGRSCF